MSDIEIDKLKQTFDWSGSDWQLQLLREADAATGKPDGKTSQVELEAYLANPLVDGKARRFVSNGHMAEVRRAIEGLPAPTGKRKGVLTRPYGDLPRGWVKQAVELADKRSDADGRTHIGEVRNHFAKNEEAQLVPEQGLAMLRSEIARETSKPDLLRIEGEGIRLTKSHMRIAYDTERRIPLVVAYVLHSEDLSTADRARISAFKADTKLEKAEWRSVPTDFDVSGYDIGHFMASADAADQKSTTATNLLSNTAPQTSAMNQHVWMKLEDSLRSVVIAADAKAYVFTGSMFLDRHGRKRLSKSDIEKGAWIGKNHQRRVAVPTHFFKIALLELPDGRVTSLAYVVANDKDMPSESEGIAKILHASRRSIRDIEELTGRDFFRDLPDDVEKAAEQSASHSVPLPAELPAAAMLWPKGTPPSAWAVQPQTQGCSWKSWGGLRSCVGL